MLLLSNQTQKIFKFLCVFFILMQCEVCAVVLSCAQSGAMWIYWEPSALHTKPTGLQISQRKHLFNKCESLAVALSPCHCVLVSILLASRSHKWGKSFAACETNPVDIFFRRGQTWTCWSACPALLKVQSHWKEAKLNSIGGLCSLPCMWGKNILVSFQRRDERNSTYCDALRLQFIYTSLYRRKRTQRRWWQIILI